MEAAEELVRAAERRRGRGPRQAAAATPSQGGREAGAESPSKPLPLHIILSTPTGSGKTFTAGTAWVDIDSIALTHAWVDIDSIALTHARVYIMD